MAFNPASTLRRSRGTFVVVLLLCAAIFLGAEVLQARSLTREQSQAQSRTRAIANEIDGRLDSASLEMPIDATTAAQLDTRLSHALSGQDVMAVRVWTPTGTLRYSTLPQDRSAPVTDLLRGSTRGLGALSSAVDGEVMTTYAPLRAGANGAPFGAVEIQQPYAPVLEAASQPWSSIRLVAATAGVLVAILLGWGFLGALPARRAAREGAGFVSPTQDDPSEELREALEEAQLALGEALAARDALQQEADQAQAHVQELERVLARERVDAAGVGERLTHARARVEELEQGLADGTVRPQPQSPWVEESSDGARVASLEAELSAALERARAAEDLAAALHDRLNEPGTETSPLGAWASLPEAPEETEEVEAGEEMGEPASEASDAQRPGMTTLRARIARTAARKKAKRREELEWP